MSRESVSIEVRQSSNLLSPTLFDYESRVTRRIAARRVEDSCYIFAPTTESNQHVTLVTGDSAALGLIPPEGNLFCMLKQIQDRFFVSLDTNREAFLSLRGRRAGEVVRLNDVVKFGKSTFKVIRIKDKRNGGSDVREGVQSVASEACYEGVDEGSCRICLSEEGPFLRLCDCKGSCGTVHLDCVRTWFTMRLVQQNECVDWLQLSKLQCELCKKKLPTVIRVNGREEELLEYRHGFDVLMMLENTEEQSGVIVYLRPNERVWVGRGASNQLQLNDSTVSRSHGWFDLRRDAIYIGDLDSKYGTMITMGATRPLARTLAMQSGRMLYTFTLL